MRLFLAVSVFLGLILPLRVSPFELPEDLEASGYDLDGSGSGDDPDQEGTNNKPDLVIMSNSADGNTNSAKSSSTLNLGSSYRHDKDTAPNLIVITNNTGLLGNNKIVEAAIAGGITGAVFGVLLSAFLIYKWMKKHKEECILRQKGSDEGNGKPFKAVVFI